MKQYLEAAEPDASPEGPEHLWWWWQLRLAEEVKGGFDRGSCSMKSLTKKVYFFTLWSCKDPCENKRIIVD